MAINEPFNIHDEKYQCITAEGETQKSSKRFLLLTPHDKYYSTQFLTQYDSKIANLEDGKIHGFPVTVTGSYAESCLTFIELPLLFNSQDFMDAFGHLKQRCFDRAIIVLDWEELKDLKGSETLEVSKSFLEFLISTYGEKFEESLQIIVLYPSNSKIRAFRLRKNIRSLFKGVLSSPDVSNTIDKGCILL